MMGEPLKITAKVRGEVAVGDGVHFDALLAAAVAMRDDLPPAYLPEEILPIEIPVDREPGGAFHLCSSGIYSAERHERRSTIKRFPVEECKELGTLRRKINLSAGRTKNYQMPRPSSYLVEDQIAFFAFGDSRAIEGLLSWITHIGKHRAAGYGIVESWEVQPCKPWEGFPVLGREGEPLRHLPVEWPGVASGSKRRYGRVTYPYWLRTCTQEVWCP